MFPGPGPQLHQPRKALPPNSLGARLTQPLPGYSRTLATTGSVTPPTTPATVIGGSDASAADKVVVWLRGACSDNNLQLEQGGIREVAIFYRLEGQDEPICIEI